MAAEEQAVQDDIQPQLDKLNSVIDAYEATAYGSDADGGELSRQRRLALEAYVGKNTEPAPKGRSQVVDWTTFETIWWILPSLIRIFTSGQIVEFDPFGPEDEDAAEQESDHLNYLVTEKNNWFLICLTWIIDCLLTKNAYCYAFMDEKLRTEVETYERQSDEQVAMLLDDDVQVEAANRYPDPDGEPEPILDEFGQPMIDPLSGQPIVEMPFLTDIQIRRTKAKKHLALKVLPPERCKVDENCPDFTLEHSNYFEYWDYESISDLRSEGYSVPDDIADDPETETQEDTARDEVLEQGTYGESNIPDPSVRRVKVRRIWVKHDFNGDGIAEMQFVLRVGRFILEREEVSTIPVSSIVPFLNTHRHMGISVADLVYDIQRIKTHILRQGLDNLSFTNNPKELFSNRVDLDALMLSRPGEKVPVDTDGPVTGHIEQSAIPFVFPAAQEGLRHMDTVTESRVGVNRMFQGIDESNINDHNRIGQLSTMASQRVELIARIIGNGMESLFRIAHEIVIKSGHQAETRKLRGEWVEFDPKQWQTGRDMRITAPYAAGNKDALMTRLLAIADIHEKALAAGLPIVQLDDVYELSQEIAAAADLPGDKFFTDPQTLPPPEPEPDPAQQALAIEAENTAIKREDSQRDAQVKAMEIESDERVKKYVADLQAGVQLIIAGAKSEDMQGLERLKADLRDKPIQMANDSITRTGDEVSALGTSIADALSGIVDQVNRLQEDLNAPVEVVRDDNGRITGKRVNGRFIPLRDAG